MATIQQAICPCGYPAQDDSDLATHLLQAGAYDTVRGRTVLRPDKPHGGKDGDNGNRLPMGRGLLLPPVRPDRRAKNPGRRDRAPDIDDPHRQGNEEDLVHVSELQPHARQYGAMAISQSVFPAVNLTAAVFVSALAAVYLGPTVAAILFAGPLAPWLSAAEWLWQHGEISVPLALAVVLLPAIPWTRRRLVRGLSRGLERLGYFLGAGLVVSCVVAFAMWLLVFGGIFLAPGVK